MAENNGIKEQLVMALGTVVEAKLHLYDYEPTSDPAMRELIRQEGRLLQRARDKIAAVIGYLDGDRGEVA
ncbi:MAG: hypothetical protein RBT47_07580 [Anaerolineae bacterium]|jgi:hypothetical protein|nr:hypothetical protein [Anaerolineae bacterium]